MHGALNTAGTGLYVLSWLDRRRGRLVRGVGASTLGYGLTLASGYLGASLVYRLGVGVDQSGARMRTRGWTPLLAAAALEAGAPQRVEVAGVGLVLFRDGNRASSRSESGARTWRPRCRMAGLTADGSCVPGTAPASNQPLGR